jgi:hypothetical protein
MSQPATDRRVPRAPLAAALALASAASAQSTLYSNGVYVNSPTGGPNGAALSIVDAAYGYRTLGFVNGAAIGGRVADDFTVPPGQTWAVQTLRFFEFSTDSGPASPFTAINLRLWNGRPGDPGASVIAGDTTTNRLTATQNVNCYRVTSTMPTEFTRPVFSADAVFAPALSLPAGHYWIDWQLASNAGAGARTVTVCPTGPGELPGANARALSGTTWVDALDAFAAYQVEFPFQLLGSGGGPGPCYANCDGSTTAPVLNVLDFNCFLNQFSAGGAYANCDGSTTAPVLNVLDFNCFLNRFSAGCP